MSQTEIGKLSSHLLLSYGGREQNIIALSEKSTIDLIFIILKYFIITLSKAKYLITSSQNSHNKIALIIIYYKLNKIQFLKQMLLNEIKL